MSRWATKTKLRTMAQNSPHAVCRKNSWSMWLLWAQRGESSLSASRPRGAAPAKSRLLCVIWTALLHGKGGISTAPTSPYSSPHCALKETLITAHCVPTPRSLHRCDTHQERTKHRHAGLKTIHLLRASQRTHLCSHVTGRELQVRAAGTWKIRVLRKMTPPSQSLLFCDILLQIAWK